MFRTRRFGSPLSFSGVPGHSVCQSSRTRRHAYGTPSMRRPCGEFRSGGSTDAGSFGPFGEPETDPIGNPIDPTRQYPADLAPSSIPVNAYHFIADRIQEASDLAHNDAQYAAAVDPALSDLLGIDSAASYAQIRTLYPRALPSLLSE